MTYEQAVGYLGDLARYGMKPGLERVGAVLRELGDPQRRLRVVHVGGTNGKGSVCAMLASILEEAGYAVGLYTQPHLESYVERFLVNGRPISEGDFAGVVSRVAPAVERAVRRGSDHPTEFEAGTAAAYLYFAERGVDVLVQEVGLGGRLDATNVVEDADLVVVTNVQVDHVDQLGSDLASIAREKAGIIKRGRPVVTAAAGVGLDEVRRRCERLGAPLVHVGTDVRFRVVSVSAHVTVVEVFGSEREYGSLSVPLAGPHQAENAAVAVASCEALAKRGYHLPDEAIREGLRRARWPGRLELMREEPAVVVDGAHNPDGARALARAVREIYHGRPVILVTGMLADKDVPGTLAELLPLAVRVIATVPSSYRAGDPDVIAAEAGARGIPCEVVRDPREAVGRAVREAGAGDLVLVAGSLYLAGRARRALAQGA